ncbi:MAG: hypothetical protein COV74_08525 [Candidatus Omnitrophica bacterium CG11_big_fil_rev_8_21_14_0_20_45_26]|uniref:Porin n=1 Tax=Candidatus Abzuiibacterium crystallinum TaxID=1974748 RepID=A0A2H0LPU7_9BACT|nr:MAG: hypothetical protein COV74_08525 [Candidatus Omnitrophica bacterium CG11_big_fil_rev_8_21_14_0_20_45_26]PIW63705.1 MAG: hypothetical protein COW12_09410 [Candidatus Omnitrophica bacterium CG12_big_fil_rev_8_21_14_0_65_45_16]
MQSKLTCKWLSVMLVLLVAFTFTGLNTAQADVSVQKLMDKIEALESKVAQLESKTGMKEHLSPVKGKEYMPPTGEGLVKTMSDIHMGGYLSTLYNVSNINPLNNGGASGTNPELVTRAFDRDEASFETSGEFVFEKPVSESSRAGFRTDWQFGRTARILNSAMVSGTGAEADDNLYIQQAYIEYLAPLGNGLDIKVGRFSTIVGAEVIESAENFNSSRGYLFNLAQPFTHNGILAEYSLNDMVDLKIGFANGWDTTVDNNRGKTGLYNITLHPTDSIDISNSLLWGPEQTRTVGGLNTDSNIRGLYDLVVSYSASDALNLIGNFDWGWEENNTGGVVGNGASQWIGVMGGAQYAVNDWLTVAGRLEWFSDNDGVRLGSISTYTTAERVNLFGMTYTADIKVADNLLTRLEWRLDKSQDSIFDLSTAAATGTGASSTQSTFGAEMIYQF